MLRHLPREAFNPDLRSEKLEQAILFFLHRASNEQLGKTKLMKLLYFADFDHYEQYEASITGARYRKLDHGPVPDDAWAALESLEQDGRVTRQDVVGEGFIQHRYEPREPVDLSVFSDTEVEVLQRVAERWAQHTTKQIEAATHGEAPWIAVRRNEVIPYYLAHYRNNFGSMDLDDDPGSGGAGLRDEDEVFT